MTPACQMQVNIKPDHYPLDIFWTIPWTATGGNLKQPKSLYSLKKLGFALTKAMKWLNLLHLPWPITKTSAMHSDHTSGSNNYVPRCLTFQKGSSSEYLSVKTIRKGECCPTPPSLLPYTSPLKWKQIWNRKYNLFHVMYISQQHHLLNKNNDIVQAKGTYCTMHNKVLLSTPIIKVLCACLMLCSLYLSVTMYTVMSLLDDFTVLIALLAFTWLYKCRLKQSRVPVALCTYATALVL